MAWALCVMATPAYSVVGLSIPDLFEMGEVTFDEIIDKAIVSKTQPVKTPIIDAEGKIYESVMINSAMTVSDLLKLEEMTVAELIGRVNAESEIHYRPLENKELLGSMVEKAEVIESINPELILSAESPRLKETKLAVASTAQDTLSINIGTQGTELQPKSIILDGAGSTYKLKISDLTGADPMVSVFVRDTNVISWDEAKKTIAGNSKGATELYVVVRNKMHIVPVEVRAENGNKTLPNIAVPAPLASLENLLDRSLAAYDDQNLLAMNNEGELQSTVKNSDPSRLSLRASAEQAQATVLREAQKAKELSKEERKATYKSLAIQVIEERSIPELKLERRGPG